MAAPKFTPAQREANLLTVSDLYLRGKTQAYIGAQIGCSQAQVSGYLKTLYGRWQQQAVEKIDRRKALELARLDRVEAEAWTAWERSTEDAQTVTTVVAPDGSPVVTTKVEGQAGDPRFLELVSKCVAQRCKIIGIEAPTKREVSGAAGGPIEISNGLFSDVERVKRIQAILKAAEAPEE